MTINTPWEKKAHSLMARYCREAYLQANPRKKNTNVRLYKKHRPYETPAIAAALEKAIGIHDDVEREKECKRLFEIERFGAWMPNMTIPKEVTNIRATQVVTARLLSRLHWRYYGIGVLHAPILEGGYEVSIQIYSPSLIQPGIKKSGNIRNQRFDVRSTVLYGALEYVEHIPGKGKEWEKYSFPYANDRVEGTEHLLVRLPGEFATKQLSYRFLEGSNYLPCRGALYSVSSLTDITICLSERLSEKEEPALILAPSYIPPVLSWEGDEINTTSHTELLHEATARLLRTACRTENQDGVSPQ